jgi:hypothetical protein
VKELFLVTVPESLFCVDVMKDTRAQQVMGWHFVCAKERNNSLSKGTQKKS